MTPRQLSFFLIALTFCTFAAADCNAETEEPGAETGAEDEPIFTEGVFFGTVKAVHEDGISIEVKAFKEVIGNKVFYLDKRTRYYVDSKRRRLDAVLPGHKVAINYIARDRFALAKIVYVEFGEFKRPEEYKRTPRRKRSRRTKSSGGGGGH